MIKSFADKLTRNLFLTGKSGRVRPDLAKKALRRMEYLEHATCLNDLKVPPSNRLHALGGKRQGQYSIRVNDQWRICFRFQDGDVYDVEFTDYHQEGKIMNLPKSGKRTRRPVHPGEMLREDFLPDYDLSVTAIAEALGVTRQTVNEVLRERRAVSPSMALRLARFFGNTPEFWLNAQRAVDLWDAEQAHKKELKRIQPLSAA